MGNSFPVPPASCRLWRGAAFRLRLPDAHPEALHPPVNLIISHKEQQPMAGENSFDVVSQYDEQELVNALDQTRREVGTRYDLKDTHTEIKQEKNAITIITSSEFTL